MLEDYTPYQQGIIKRFYKHQGSLHRQRLAELVSELYLAQGKKLERTWKAAGDAMQKLGIPQSRIDHLLQKRDPALVAQVVMELDATR